MSIQITPEQEARINGLARQTGRDTTEVLGEVIESYFDELARINATLDRRYDEIKSGPVKPTSDDAVLERLEAGRPGAHRRRAEAPVRRRKVEAGVDLRVRRLGARLQLRAARL